MGRVTKVDTRDGYAEFLEPLKLVSHGVLADRGSYLDATFKQSPRDAPAETSGSSRHNDDRPIHRSNINPNDAQ